MNIKVAAFTVSVKSSTTPRINVHDGIISGARCLNNGMNLNVHPFLRTEQRRFWSPEPSLLAPKCDKYTWVFQIQRLFGSIFKFCNMSHDMGFPTMWHIDKCRLRLAYAASFKLRNSKCCSVSNLTVIVYSSD